MEETPEPATPESSPRAPLERPVLPYSQPSSGRMVTVGTYGSEVEAGLPAAELDGEGIPCQVINANVNGLGFPYNGWSQVELQVREGDAEEAAEILARVNADDLEPADESSRPAPVGDDGALLKLEVAGAFETVRAMREAQMALASSGIRAIVPRLERRGDAPPGTGARFILHVEADAAEDARALLAETAAEQSENDDARCPRCGSWRLYPVAQYLKSLAAIFGGPRPDPQLECLQCRYRGAATEFQPRRTPT